VPAHLFSPALVGLLLSIFPFYMRKARLSGRVGRTVPWRQDGGQAITFASDAHSPDRLAAGFAEAVRVADAAGFSAGNDPLGLWHRR